MSFSVSYVFQARDRYTTIARKVAAANDRLKRSTEAAAASFKRKLGPALESVQARMRSIRNVGLGMTAAVTLPFALAARSAANFAAEAVETRSKFATVFESLGDGAESVADDFAKNFGLASSTARALLGDTGDLLVGFGFTEDKALDVARQVNELAVDLASFSNFAGGAEGASAALTKALLGERESMKSLGVVITEDLVKRKIQTMLSEGQKFANLAEAKALATLAIAADQSRKAIGDYARTQESSANLTRRRIEENKELRETFGKLLLPIQDRINLAVIRFSETLQNLSPNMQRVVLVVGGVVAALGPLLLIVGTIGVALPALATGFAAVGSAIVLLTGPIGIITALTAAIITFLIKTDAVSKAVGGAIFRIVEAFQSMRTMVGDVIAKVIDFVQPLLGVFDKIKNIAAKLGLIDLPAAEVALSAASIGAIEAQLATVEPAVATANARATVNGQIMVSASPGSQVDSVESQNAFAGAQGNIGLGVAQ